MMDSTPRGQFIHCKYYSEMQLNVMVMNIKIPDIIRLLIVGPIDFHFFSFYDFNCFYESSKTYSIDSTYYR